MPGSVIGKLVGKDWTLYRKGVFISMAGAAAALGVVQWGGEGPVVVGSVFFFIALVVAAGMMPLHAIVGERKKHNLAFVMSLPVSPMQYSTAKLSASLLMFLGPWCAMVTAAVLLVESRKVLPHGVIPTLLILSLLPVVGFCMVTGTALVSESEGWTTASMVVCNSTYGLVWYGMTKISGIMDHVKEAAPVWNSTALKLIGGEVAACAAMLAITYFLQSRKRDFI